MKTVPLTYQGRKVGEATISDDGKTIDAVIDDDNRDLLGSPGVYSIGFEYHIEAGSTVRLGRRPIPAEPKEK